MRPEMAKLVYPVFHYGLQLKERLEENHEKLELETEQAKLRGYLQSEMEARRNPEYAGDSGISSGGSSVQGLDRRAKDGFLGPRYALACWLDEIFILHSPWQRQWNERSLETALYGTRNRAFQFWDQARRAAARTGEDALEVFYLCVLLGFRGDYREEPAKLEAWVSETRTRLNRGHEKEWDGPAASNPPTNVPPRLARARFQRTGLYLAATTVVALFLIVFIAVQWLGKK